MISSGDIISGRYEIISHVGRGGMQEVFRAKDLLLNTSVAVKTPQEGQATKRFSDSAVFAARVNHHNVAKTLDYIEENSRCFLVEEFVVGETLEAKLGKLRFADPHLGAQVLHHMAKGIAASHHASVVHRDLKPSNVMAAPGVNLKDLKITDFGIATLAAEIFDEQAKSGDLTLSNSGTVKGALPYMAPEMMFRKPGEHPGPPADIWSLGAMMFQLLTGDYPFGVFLEAAVNVKNGHRKAWPDFMKRNPQFTPLVEQLQEIVESCLQNEPTKRPSADDIVLRCGELCYNSAPRIEGQIHRIIQSGESGFIKTGQEEVFFSSKSLYGPTRSEIRVGTKVAVSCFNGHPRRRAHPILILS